MDELGLLEILAGLAVVLMGWLHGRQNKLEDELDAKADKDSLAEIKEILKEMTKCVNEMKVENARWQGLVEKVTNNKHGRS